MPTNPMARRLTRAAVATAAAVTLASCSDSSGPSDTIPNAEEAEQIGYMIASELLTSVGSLNPDVAMTSPTFALLADPSLSSRESGTAPLRRSPMLRAYTVLGSGPNECGTYSPAVPADTDGDGIPDDLTVTYTLPDCSFPDEFGGTMDMTGSMHIEDDTPAVAGMSFSLTMTELRVAIEDPEFGTMSATREGQGSVTHTASQLGQVHDFVTEVEAAGASGRVATEWDLQFFAAQGAVIAAGQPLPDGTYAPSGTMMVEQARSLFSFTLSAPTPLAYSAACAADPMTYDNPFTAGVLRATVDANGDHGYVEIEYFDCMEPTVTYYEGGVS